MSELLREIRRRKGRTGMTIIAIALSVSLLISMNSIAEGLLQSALKDLNESKRDIIMMTEGKYGIESGHRIADDIFKNKYIECISIELGTIATTLKLSIQNKKINITAFAEGIVPEKYEKSLTKKERENFPKYGCLGFNKCSDEHYDNNYTGNWSYEILISDTIAKKFDIDKGSSIYIHYLSDTYLFNVSGVFKTEFTTSGALGELYFLILHLSELQTILKIDKENSTILDRVDRIALTLSNEAKKSKEKVEEVKNFLKEKYPYYSIITKEDRLKKIQKHVGIATGFYIAIGSVAIIIGMLFLTCIMVISVFERTNEIGVMRAIGISKRSIFSQIFLEALGICFIGAFLGILPGYYGSILLGEYIEASQGIETDFIVFNIYSIANAVFMTIFLGAFACLYPAY
ncbi:MAG: FtsX-like permease family protein, partial [Candidatus Thermoplasmatota archaeon]